MRVFKTKPFARFVRKHRITDAELCVAVTRLESGQVDADLGGGVFKQRIARPNEGKSGGYRTIVLARFGHAAFFVFGFAKNQRANIDQRELEGFRELATVLLRLEADGLDSAVRGGALIEVKCENSDLQD